MEVVKGLTVVLGLFLFKKPLSDLEKETELSHIKFTNDAKYCETLFTLEGRADI